jgi:dCMP deaminase
MREDKAEKYFSLAKFQAELFSKDPHTKVGALFLAPQSHQILSTGFNGFPRKVDETDATRWERPNKYHYVSHAEANGICNASRHGTPLEDSIAIVTMFPCATCAKMLIQCGIKELITVKPNFEDPRWGEEFVYSNEMLTEANVTLQFVDK